MKRIPLLIATAIILTGCSSLFQIHDKDDYGGYKYGTTNNKGYSSTQHVTQQSHSSTARRPRTGDIVYSLPNRGVKTVTVQGERLYLVDGIYYKPVHSNQGVVYRIVGTTR